MNLSDLPNGVLAEVVALRGAGAAIADSTLRRLAELGFIEGEPVRVLRRGPGGREPLAVQVGDTQFALRWLEASCIQVQS